MHTYIHSNNKSGNRLFRQHGAEGQAVARVPQGGREQRRPEDDQDVQGQAEEGNEEEGAYSAEREAVLFEYRL